MHPDVIAMQSDIVGSASAVISYKTIGNVIDF